MAFFFYNPRKGSPHISVSLSFSCLTYVTLAQNSGKFVKHDLPSLNTCWLSKQSYLSKCFFSPDYLLLYLMHVSDAAVAYLLGLNLSS